MASASSHPTAEELQQQFADMNGVGGLIMWDLFTSQEEDQLRTKLKHLIPDINIDVEKQKIYKENGGNLKPVNKFVLKAEKQNEKQRDLRNILMDAIWAQRKYCNKDLLMSIIFVLVTPRHWRDAKSLTEYSCHPVFRIRKCTVNDDSKNCCMVFVDENGRVYKNWSDYLDNNTLPRGRMVVPHMGVYQYFSVITKENGVVTTKHKVKIDVVESPANSESKAVLKAVDRSASVLGLSSAIIPAAAIFVPIAAPFVIMSAIACATTSLWSIGRSTANLVDRGLHEESINVTNRQARSDWIGIAGGVVGLGASGATQGVVRYASKGGEVSKLAQVAVNGVNVASITINGIGIGNGIVEIILKVSDDESISALDILQLSASLVLFTHSIYNFRLVSNIMSESGGTMNKFRRLLSESQRQIYDRIVAETTRITGVQKNIDIIRASGTIPDYTYENGIPASIVTTIVGELVNTVSRIISTTDLTNCISYMIEKTTESTIKILIEITQAFFDEFGVALEKKFQRIFPFEGVLWKAYNIATSLYPGCNLTSIPLIVIKGKIINKLWNTLIANMRTVYGNKIKCDTCAGYYSITSLD